MTQSEPVSFGIDGRLDTDVLCAGCGHNVRGLLPTGACGECGLPVRWSIGGTTIGAADPTWLARIRSGVAMVTCLLPWMIIPLLWPVFALGLWRLTTPEPGGRRPGRPVVYYGLRPLLVWSLCTLLPLACFYSAEPAGARVEILIIFATAFGMSTLLAASGIRQIAQRARARRMAAWAAAAGVIGMTGCVSWGLVLALNRLMSSSQSIDVETLMAIALVLGCVSLLGVIPLAILLILTWRLLQRAEYEAHGLRGGLKAWQGPTPGASSGPWVEASTGGATTSDCRAEA